MPTSLPGLLVPAQPGHSTVHCRPLSPRPAISSGIFPAVMIGVVLYAARDPAGKDSGQRSRWTVSGGTFRSDSRQQMPHRDVGPPEALSRQGEAGKGQAVGRDRPAG